MSFGNSISVSNGLYPGLGLGPNCLKGYQQTTKVDATKERDMLPSIIVNGTKTDKTNERKKRNEFVLLTHTLLWRALYLAIAFSLHPVMHDIYATTIEKYEYYLNYQKF